MPVGVFVAFLAHRIANTFVSKSFPYWVVICQEFQVIVEFKNVTSQVGGGQGEVLVFGVATEHGIIGDVGEGDEVAF